MKTEMCQTVRMSDYNENRDGLTVRMSDYNKNRDGLTVRMSDYNENRDVSDCQDVRLQ